jgi:2-oxo-3-hexenedioate decarboxylase
LGFKSDLPSVGADNCSSARYANDLDLGSLCVVVERNGEVVAIAASGAVMGHPADAVKPGDHILARYQELGSVSVRLIGAENSE